MSMVLQEVFAKKQSEEDKKVINNKNKQWYT